MDTLGWIIVIAVVLVVAALAWFLVRQSRTRALQRDFGPEYDRTMARAGDRSMAESAASVSQLWTFGLSRDPITIGSRPSGRRCRRRSWTRPPKRSRTPTS